ncbi:MAG: hypothetical protein KDB66_02985 [Solirubrobacterales bacterium]|nr:hypothetical protein [Solirubrobacterales bacterium]
MSLNNALSAAYGLARVGFGVFVTSAPQRMGRTWVGGDADSDGAGVILRALGFRDIALGAGLAEASFRGDPRGWLAVTMLSDLGDVAATLSGSQKIDSRGVAITTLLAGSGAAAAGVLLLTREPE